MHTLSSYHVFMRRWRVVLSGVFLTAVLTSCGAVQPGMLATTTEAADESTSQPVVAAQGQGSSSENVDAKGQERAEGWLAAVQMPEGAEFSETMPDRAGLLGQVSPGSHCDPVAIVKGYWILEETSLPDVLDWVLEHPIEGMTTFGSGISDADVGDETLFVSATYVPWVGAYEGVAFTIVNLDATTVGVKATSLAFGDNTVCPEPEPGASWGGFGEG